MSGAATPPPAPAAPPPMGLPRPARVVVPLAPGQRPLRDVVNKQISTTFHLCRDPVLAPLLRRRRAGTNPAVLEHIPASQLQSIITALMETKESNPGNLEPPGAPSRATMLNTPIDTFNAMTNAEQFALLNRLWAKCYDAVLPVTVAKAMVDDAMVVHPTTGSLPSSLRPANPDIRDAVCVAGPTPTAWKAYQIGFRVEGGFRRSGATPDADLTRARTVGIAPLATNTPTALALVGKSYWDLDVSAGTHVHLGYQNRDVYNESATCVSRTLLGATAFPLRDTITSSDSCAYRYLFACDCSDLQGVDTENWQRTQPGSNLWRPGEKAFLRIPPERILGYTALERRALDESASWRFMFQTSSWTWVNPPDPPVQAYLNAELGCWNPRQWYDVPLGYDFQT